MDSGLYVDSTLYLALRRFSSLRKPAKI